MEKLPPSSIKQAGGSNDRENESPTRTDALDELFRTYGRFKDTVEAKQELKRQWRQRKSAVDYGNWKLEMELEKLRGEVDELDKELLAKADESQKAQDDLETYKSRNKQEAADFWNYFQEETQKYSNLYTNAHIEYSTVCLNQDTEEYRRQSEILREKIARVEQEMEAAKAQYGLVELGTNEQAKLLADLDAVKKALSDKEGILRATQATEETINVLKLKLKQKQHDIAYLKNKTSKK